jgi:hypothetical protein
MTRDAFVAFRWAPNPVTICHGYLTENSLPKTSPDPGREYGQPLYFNSSFYLIFIENPCFTEEVGGCASPREPFMIFAEASCKIIHAMPYPDIVF